MVTASRCGREYPGSTPGTHPNKYMQARRGRPRKGELTVKEGRLPDQHEIDTLIEKVVGTGELVDRSNFRDWMATRCERELWFFTRWVGGKSEDGSWGNDWIDSQFHREMCRFLTDYTKNRRKLLMCPIVHLKTSIASQSLPIHALVAHPRNNIYFPGRWGCDSVIVLANESEAKCKENLSVVKSHFESNIWIAWLWPHVVWKNPKTDAPRWTDFAIELPRNVVRAEPTVTAIGAETGVMGRHYDIRILDDLAGLKAGQSMDVMERARRTMRALRTRYREAEFSLELTVGTHQSPDDIYTERMKDASVEVMKRAIIEDDKPLWPERWTMEAIDKVFKETDSVEWAHFYMNEPASSKFTALDWKTLREYRRDGDLLAFVEDEKRDKALEERAAVFNNHPVLRLLTGPRQVKSSLEQLQQRYRGQGGDLEWADHLRMKYPERMEE